MDLVAREVDSDMLRDTIIDMYNGACFERTARQKYDLSSWLVQNGIEALSHFQLHCTLNTRRAQSKESQTYQMYQWATKYANAEMPNNAYTYKEMTCAASCYITGASVYQTLTAIDIEQNTEQSK
eukprot:3688284-Ditylum_brightwellii.AAC.1